MANRNVKVSIRMANGVEGKRMRRIRGARAAHRAIRASGRRPCEEANRAVRLRNLLASVNGPGLGGEYHDDAIGNTLE